MIQTIVLASQSPRRKKLFEQIKLEFTVHSSSVDETYDANALPEDIVQMLALRKAVDVASAYPQALVIGADTIVVHNKIVLEKPSTPDEARKMLSNLSRSTHEVYTGVALIKTNRSGDIDRQCSFYERTLVTFGALTDSEIKQYVETGSPMDKAGAYGIQDDWGALFVERIEGDYNNVVGFPLFQFHNKLKDFAPECLPSATN